MKIRVLALALASAAFAASALVIESGRAQPAAPAAPAGGGLTILEFKPAFDDLMTMLIQPRHIKLFAAGQQKNWELAAFQLNELRQGLRRIGQTIPKYRTYAVDNSVASFFTPAAEKMAAAIKAGDAAQFNAAYGELTTACNSCHQGMDHPFLVIKAPDANAMSPYVDQDFAAAKK
jgi:cytochrome c'